MRYRQRASKAVSAWIADSDYTHGGEVVCGLRHVYRGVWGCPAWAAGQPCSYCFLKGTARGDADLLEGVAWVDREPGESPMITCVTCGQDFHPEDLDQVFYHEQVPHRPLTDEEQALALCDCRQLMTANNARAAVMKWLLDTRVNPDVTCSLYERQCKKILTSTGRLVETWYARPQLLNGGEYTDSLAWTPEQNPHLAMLLDLFSDPLTNPYGHKLLLASKGGLEATKAHLEGRQPSPNVILSWSIGNLGEDAEPHWLPAFYPGSRLVAADWMLLDGWRVRLRLDPLGPGHDWQADVRQYATTTIAHFVPQKQHPLPELITLGTLRHNGGRVKLPADERVGIYREAIDGLRQGGYMGDIGLCKETPDMIRTILGIEPHEMRCNCLP